MLKTEIKELEIDKELLKKINMICKFANVKPTIINGSIISIKGTNIAYVKPHILSINNTNYLIFNDYDYIFINDYNKKIKYKNLLEYLKKI